ncbi:MAG: hypothetical protein CSA39_00805 [Flavobacteriales bacterium]|nr:MAG: hypothetical protein CSA39_00805 [Flavobacteriales bacterium]
MPVAFNAILAKILKTLFLTLFIWNLSYAQYYGVDGGIIAGLVIARHLIEAKYYKEIELENFIKFLIKNKESCGHNINRTQVNIA